MADQETGEARGFGRVGAGERAASERREIWARRLDGEDGKDHGVGVVDVEHEAGDEGEEKPLGKGARRARLMPIPKEESDGERRLRVRPGGIEIHVHGKRAGPPDGNGGEERATFADVLARETEGEQQAEKTVDGGGERHSDAVGRGEPVGGDGGAQSAGDQDAGVGENKERSPQNRGADGEVVFEMAGGRAKVGFGLALFVEARAAKTFVGMPVVFGEIEIVLNQRGAGKRVIADTIAAHPGIEKWERTKKEKKKQALGITQAGKRRWAEVLPMHERGTRRKLPLSPATIITAQQPISQDRGRDLVTAKDRGGSIPHDFTSKLNIRKLKRGAFIRAILKPNE